jgi:GAF domain-containing protein
MESTKEHKTLDTKAKLELLVQTQKKLLDADFDLSSFMDLVVEEMQLLTPATGVVVELVEGDEMVYRAATGTVKDYIGLRLTIQGSISGLCVQKQEVLISNDTEKDPRVNVEACRRVSARSLVVAPLMHLGRAVGVLKILSRAPDDFTDEDVKTLQLMSGFLASALANQILQEIKNSM